LTEDVRSQESSFAANTHRCLGCPRIVALLA
jgi:hypothetical protein